MLLFFNVFYFRCDSERTEAGNDCSNSKARCLVNSFAINILQNLTKDNYVLATASLSLLLAMAEAATIDDRFCKTEDVGEDDVTVHEAMQYTLRLVEGKNDLTGNEAILFQNIWIRKERTLSTKARSLLAKYYCCEANTLPVNNNNNIHERKLKKKLNKLDVTGRFHEHFQTANFQNISTQEMFLTTAVHIAMTWREPFSSHLTRKSQFHISDHEVVHVNVMTHRIGLSCISDDVIQATVLQLPLTAHNMCMLFYLPYEKNGLEFLEKNLTEESFSKVLSKLQSTKPKPVNISIPKFSLLENDHLSKDVLESVTKASKCEIFHTMMLVANEQGLNVPLTSSHQATTIGPAVHDGLRWTQFTANHPFLFMLVDQRSKLIFITGKVSQPHMNQEINEKFYTCHNKPKRNWRCF